MLYLVDFCIVAFVFGIGGDSQSQTPSPKRMHSYKSSANAESFSESDGDDDRGEVASFYNKLTIIKILELIVHIVAQSAFETSEK